MAGTAVASYGTIVKKATSAQANITGVSFSGMTRDEFESTDLTDTWKSYIDGAADGGTIDLQINVSEALVQAFMPSPATSSSAAFEIDFPAPIGKFTFSAIITSFAPEASIGNAITGTITLRITGAVTYVASS